MVERGKPRYDYTYSFGDFMKCTSALKLAGKRPWLNRLRIEHAMKSRDADGDEFREHLKAILQKKLTAPQPEAIRRRLDKELAKLTPRKRRKR